MELGSPYLGWRAKALSVGQCELVVVQDRVKILNPLWVHITIEDDPLELVQLTAHIVD